MLALYFPGNGADCRLIGDLVQEIDLSLSAEKAALSTLLSEIKKLNIVVDERYVNQPSPFLALVNVLFPYAGAHPHHVAESQ